MAELVQPTPSADYATETAAGPPNGTYHEIDLFRAPAATAQNAVHERAHLVGPADSRWADRVCPGTQEHGRDGACGDHRRWPSGQMDRHQLAPTWKGTCPGLPKSTPIANYLAYAGSDNNDYGIGISGHEQQRLIFVDLGSGNTMLVVADSVDPARFSQLVGDAMPIIGSLSLK